MINITVGMILSCFVKISSPGVYGSFVKNVPTSILFINKQGDKTIALVEYDFSRATGIFYLGDDKLLDLIDIDDLKSETYGRCKLAKEQKEKQL